MRVACPAGSGPGSAFMVAHPTTGEHFQVTVPDGVAEGQHFEVQVARPAIMATAAPPVMIQQPVVVQQPGPVIITSGPQQVGGDRTKVQPGLTALRQPGVITLSSWEVKEPSLCDTIHLALRCSVADTSRSYIYIRDDHALELNNTMGLLNCCTCFCCCETPDNVRVEHFDRPPWAKECNTAPFPYCCCIYQVCAQEVPAIRSRTYMRPLIARAAARAFASDGKVRRGVTGSCHLQLLSASAAPSQPFLPDAWPCLLGAAEPAQTRGRRSWLYVLRRQD